VRHRVKAETIATAIKIGDPASYERAVWAIRATRGAVTAVSDADILETKAVIDQSGTGCEPASAASVAGVRQMVRAGVIARSARVVAVLTGHVLKDVTSAAGSNRPVEIDATVDAVAKAM